MATLLILVQTFHSKSQHVMGLNDMKKHICDVTAILVLILVGMTTFAFHFQ